MGSLSWLHGPCVPSLTPLGDGKRTDRLVGVTKMRKLSCYGEESSPPGMCKPVFVAIFAIRYDLGEEPPWTIHIVLPHKRALSNGNTRAM